MAKIARWMSAMMVAGLVYIPADVSAQQIFNTRELTEIPAIKSAEQAKRVIVRTYPGNLQSRGIGGTVQLRFVIDADGKVVEDSVDIIAAWSKLLGDAAAEAVTDIEFIPGKKDGSAVSSVVMMPIRYAFQ